VPENKVISLGKRAEDEERPFFEQLLQEGARKCLLSEVRDEWQGNGPGTQRALIACPLWNFGCVCDRQSTAKNRTIEGEL
jgi:hypothetical protein